MAARAPPPKRGAGTLAPSPLGQRRKPNNVDETPQPAAGARSAAAAAGQSAQNAQTEEAVNALLDAMDAGLTGGEELEPYPGALTVDLMTHQVSPLARHSSPEDAAGPPAPRTSPKPLKALRSPPHPSIPSQRVGLGWMMAKESSESAPRGGLLADDQGLGKTISTLALVVSHRPPAGWMGGREEPRPLRVERPLSAAGADGPSASSGGGPAAWSGPTRRGGTLIVCPTTVLQQWLREVRTRVGAAAGLSAYAYHGPGRTQDAGVLARYDVVITTYSILSQHLPSAVGQVGPGPRPSPAPSCGSRSSPGAEEAAGPSRSGSAGGAGGGVACGWVGTAAGRPVTPTLHARDPDPLFQLRWFRVILDEAQLIKNSRTRACRGALALEAEHRWLLTGTPIQNTVDELQAFFAFLRLPVFSDPTQFRAQIRDPIAQGRPGGVERLRVVLSGVALRRTKATLGKDGRPLVALPPRTSRTVSVRFTAADQVAYDRLRREGQLQLAGKDAAATAQRKEQGEGTGCDAGGDANSPAARGRNVGVSLLLTMLRLRQCCNHPWLPSPPPELEARQHRRRGDRAAAGGAGTAALPVAARAARALLPSQRAAMLASLSRVRAALRGTLEDGVEPETCALCGTFPEDPVVGTCTHVFCAECAAARTATAGAVSVGAGASASGGGGGGGEREAALECPRCGGELGAADLFETAALVGAEMNAQNGGPSGGPLGRGGRSGAGGVGRRGEATWEDAAPLPPMPRSAKMRALVDLLLQALSGSDGGDGSWGATIPAVAGAEAPRPGGAATAAASGGLAPAGHSADATAGGTPSSAGPAISREGGQGSGSVPRPPPPRAAKLPASLARALKRGGSSGRLSAAMRKVTGTPPPPAAASSVARALGGGAPGIARSTSTLSFGGGAAGAPSGPTTPPSVQPAAVGAAMAGSAPALSRGAHAATPPPRDFRPSKVIVFSQWTSMLDLVELVLVEEGIGYRRLDGTMSVAARDAAVREFAAAPPQSASHRGPGFGGHVSAADAPPNVMLMSLKAAALGLNLACANRVVLLDPWFNPAVEEQAVDRAHRIGQTRHVEVVRLQVADSVEDFIARLQEAKRGLSQDALSCGPGPGAMASEGSVLGAAGGTGGGGGQGVLGAMTGELSRAELFALFGLPPSTDGGGAKGAAAGAAKAEANA